MHEFLWNLVYISCYGIVALIVLFIISYAKGCALKRAKEKNAQRYWHHYDSDTWMIAQFFIPLFWPIAPIIGGICLATWVLAKMYSKYIDPLRKKLEKLGEDKGCGK